MASIFPIPCAFLQKKWKNILIIKYNNSTKQLTSSDVRKILTDNTIIIYKYNNKNRLQILEATCRKNK